MKKSFEGFSLQSEELRGPVKRVKQMAYEPVARSGRYVPGVLHSNSFLNAISTFSREGFLAEKLEFNDSGDLVSQTSYTADGRIKSNIQCGQDGSVKSTSEYTYDEAGNLTEIVNNAGDKSTAGVWLSRMVYNERGFCTDYITTHNSVLHGRHASRHDDEGNVIEQFIYDKDDKLERRLERTFNAKGQQVEEKDYNAKGELTRHTISHYDGPDGAYSGSTKNGVYSPCSLRYFDREQETAHDHHANWTASIEYESGDWKEGDRPELFHFREITYYGEPSEKTVLDFENVIYDMTAEQHPIPPAAPHNSLSLVQWQWVAEGATEYEPFSVNRYYTAAHGFFPACMSVSAYQVDLWSLKNYLIASYGAAEVWEKASAKGSIWHREYEHYVLAFRETGYILEADDIQHLNAFHYEYAGRPATPAAGLSNNVQIGHLSLYYPPAGFGARNMDFENELGDIISSFRVKKKAEQPQISMVTVLGNSFSLKAYPIKDDFEIKDLDLNYGNRFEKFHKGLMEKFTTTKQGLILFHGEPGTGKTFYVRHLLRKMQESRKEVIYMPPNMVDHLVEPSFMTFISTQVAAFSANGKSCIMLVEDAEPLLVTRDENTRIQGITNLLNMTDGLLNDMLGMQIICTFNVPLKELDKALLRPGRLIARKEFKALPEFEANVLAHSLGIKHVFKKPATLSEIYAKAPDKEMLTHDE